MEKCYFLEQRLSVNLIEVNVKETILVVDDEEDIVELIRHNLAKEGYSVLTALTGEQAISISKQSLPDLIVLDLMLPGIDGLQVTKNLKKNRTTQEIPIVMLTAKSEESDVITGLEAGANDYISKPFSPRELAARIRAVLRTRNKNSADTENRITQKGKLMIDRAKYLVSIDGEAYDLTLTEFKLLSFLAGKEGWVFSRGQIVDAIHGDDYAVTERSIDVILVGLRKKLKQHAKMIETVRGAGYRFKG